MGLTIPFSGRASRKREPVARRTRRRAQLLWTSLTACSRRERSPENVSGAFLRGSWRPTFGRSAWPTEATLEHLDVGDQAELDRHEAGVLVEGACRRIVGCDPARHESR